MATKVEYEWCYETLDDNDDIIDNTFEDKLANLNKPDEKCRLVLVRSEGGENQGVTDRAWAYVIDGKLPDYFENANNQPINTKVPKRFHEELKNTKVI